MPVCQWSIQETRRIMIDVRMPPAAAAEDAALVNELSALVNSVYAVAEEGLWADGTSRTTPETMAELIAAGQIAVARGDERIVGAVRVQRLDTGEGEFGMLVADPAHRGQGVGRELVRFAERWCRERGLDRMQLEVLVPRQWSHPSRSSLQPGTPASATARWRPGSSRRPIPSSRRCSRHPATSSSIARICRTWLTPEGCDTE
jgi:GNAT superfamily N-acetyltransferase